MIIHGILNVKDSDQLAKKIRNDGKEFADWNCSSLKRRLGIDYIVGGLFDTL